MLWVRGIERALSTCSSGGLSIVDNQFIEIAESLVATANCCTTGSASFSQCRYCALATPHALAFLFAGFLF